jgi:hypothetical protein
VTENRFITYSIIRCADEDRDEMLNVGILALDPEIGKVDVRTVADLNRVKRTLPNIPTGHLAEYLASLPEYFAASSARPFTPERLDQFVREWGNGVRLSMPRSVAAPNSAAAVEQLFQRHVQVGSTVIEQSDAGATALQPAVTSRRIVRQVITRLRRRGFRDKRDFVLDARVTGETRAATPVPVWFPLLVSRQLLVDSMEVKEGNEQRTIDGARLLASKSQEALRSKDKLDVAIVIGESQRRKLNEMVESVISDEGRTQGRAPRLFWQTEVDDLVASAPHAQLSMMPEGTRRLRK